MTVDTVTLTGSFSPDGTNNDLGSFTPAAGELYYVDKLRVECDGAGGQVTGYTTRVDFWTKAGPTPAPGQRSWGSASTSVSPQDDDHQTSTGTVGEYLTEDETLYITDENSDNPSTAATYYYAITLRRVL